MYFQPASGAGATAAAHATITAVTAIPSAPTRFEPMPIFPVGAKVWLTKNPAAESTLFYPQPSSIVVRDRQGGTLLFAAVRNTEPPLTSPVVLSAVSDDCAAMGANFCTRNATVTHQTVAIHGDTAVTVRDGETTVVTIGGIAYDVSVLARRTSSPAGSGSCPDYYPPIGVSLDVWARDLASRIAGLEVGALPACVMGNDPEQSASISLYDSDTRVPYELPLSYLRRGQIPPDELIFSAPTAASVSGDPAMPSVGLYAPGIFPEPTVGQEFWVSAPEESVKVIRRSQTTPAIIGYFGYSAASRSNIERVMGTTVTAESCQYASADPATGAGPWLAWEVLFGTPAVRVKSGSHGAIQIAGRNYDVWVDPYAGSMPFVSFVER